jgi:hypothetical protein
MMGLEPDNFQVPWAAMDAAAALEAGVRVMCHCGKKAELDPNHSKRVMPRYYV